MVLRLVAAAGLIAAVGLLAGWSDRLHLLAMAVALAVLALVGLAARALRRRGGAGEAEGGLDEEEARASSVLRDGLIGLTLGGAALLVSAAIYAWLLPPFYPLLVGDCPRILPRLAIYEEAKAWPQAVAVIDARLARPLDNACRTQLAERKCRYLIEWSKTLPRAEAQKKLAEVERYAQENRLPNYREIARLMQSQLEPTPAPRLVTPTPTPAPTPRNLAGAQAELTGLDLTYFPPTVFAHLRVTDAAGQPIANLGTSDVRVYDDGQPVPGYSLSAFSQEPAPVCAALVIDYSGSMAGAPLEAAKAGARTFLSLLRDGDQVEVIGFGDRAELLQARTTDRQAAAAALDLRPAKDWTALWDALWLAANDLSGCPGRRAAVLMTDGADNRSQHTQEEVAQQLRRAGLSLFVIGLRSNEYNGPVLQALVEAVGGRYAEASDPGQLEAYYRDVAGTIRNEYRLALTLTRPPGGGPHRLRIELGGPQPVVVEQTYQDPGH